MMKNRSRRLAGLIERQRPHALAAGIIAGMVILAGMAVQIRPHPSDHQFLCTLKSGANRGKLVSRSVFDSRSAASRMDRILSGALQFASSL
jgi:hypothetical protein